jgi:sialate O-acetylesterase
MRITSGILSGHVLQRAPRGARVRISGETSASGTVTLVLSAAGKTVRGWTGKKVGKATKGSFSADVKGLPTGGPYTLTLQCGSDQVAVPDIYVGDLWLMAGQSNLEGCGYLANAPKPHPLVRNFSMGRYWELARDPLHHRAESADVVHNSGRPETRSEAAKAKRARLKGAGVGVYFGHEMVARSGVPQGLIATAQGGTSMAQWSPEKRDLGGASLYGSMLASLRAVGQPIAGVLWYQGCSDTSVEAEQVYTKKMQELVAAVRKDLKQPKLPWITVQIARVVGNGAGGREWNSIQEQQRLLPGVIKHLETVAAIDLELDDLIHVSTAAYATLAARMARAAARLALGDRREKPAPRQVTAKLLPQQLSGPVVEVHYPDAVGGLHSPGLPQGFTFVDPQHQPVDIIYKTVLTKDRALLHLTSLDRTDLRLMYGHGRNPICNVTDGRGFALPVFGPLVLRGMTPISPFLATWDVSSVRPGEDISKLPEPTSAAFGPLERKAWADRRFTNQHEIWQNQSGHAAFFGEITLAEAMALEVRFGYDGPVRLWIGGQEVFRDLHGTNPAIVDAKRKQVRLKAGTHPVTVLMALNGGRAWGFFLRFARRDGTGPVSQVPVPGVWI